MRLAWKLLFNLLITNFVITNLAWSQNSRSLILKNSNHMVRDTKNDIIILEGDVQLIFGLQYLAADKAIIHTKKKNIEASGNVVYNTPELYAEADRIYYNYDKNTGIIYNGFIQSGQVSFEGKVIYKIGEKEFEVEDGYYTSCFTCPPAWSLSGKKIKANFGKSAVLRNTTFRIANFPFFWFPYLEVPLHSNRQSGFLAPELEFGNQAGYTFSMPYYYVINESKDLTFTPKSYENRGLKTLFDYRYRLGPHSTGSFSTAWIRDRYFPESDILKSSSLAPTNSDGSVKAIDRWFFSYKHDYKLPNHFDHKVNLNLASDLQYPLDFQKEFDFIGEPALPNRMSLSKNTDYSHFSIDNEIYINLLKSEPLDSNDDAVHRLPDIRLDLTSSPLMNTNFFYNFHMNYTNFSRSSYSFDKIDQSTPENPVTPHDGTYNPDNDLIRTGQRLIFRPEIYYPIHWGKFEFTPSLSHQENLYQFSVDEKRAAESRFTQLGVFTRTQFSRVYNGDNKQPIKHIIEPSIDYKQIPFNYQKEHPFFGDETLEPYSPDRFVTDGDPLQFDYNDRQANRNLVTFNIKNLWIKKTTVNDSPYYHQMISWNLSQSLDLYDDSLANQANQPWSAIASNLKFYGSRTALYQDLYYYPYHNVINSKTGGSIYFPRSSHITLAYDQSFSVTPGVSVDTSENYKQDWQLSTRMNFNYFNFAALVNYSTVTHEIVNYKTGVILTPPGRCWSIVFYRDVPTRGDATYSIYFDLLYDGNPESNIYKNIF